MARATRDRWQTCAACSKPHSVRPGRKYCSQACMAAGQRKPVSLRACETCGSSIPRHVWPSSGQPESPASYAKRKHCSRDCAAAAHRGWTPPTRKDDPEKSCAHCGVRMFRRHTSAGRLEGIAAFLKRRFCSGDCLRKYRLANTAVVGYMVNSGHLRNPHSIGRRLVVCQTCLECGELKMGEEFDRQYGSSRTCIACRRSRASEVNPIWYRAKWHETSVTAFRHRQEWTGPELEVVATRDDLSITEMARILGRTYGAISRARSLVRRGDPAKLDLAGISHDLVT